MVPIFWEERAVAGKLAVVLSGGGAKGAFQVGVLDELITNRGINFDIFCGVSTGSIQALGGAMGDIGALVSEWTAIRGNKDVYSRNPLGAVGALFGTDSLFDAKKLRTKLKRFADPAKLAASGKILRVGVVNLATGLYQDVDGSAPNIGDWVYASCAQPPYFAPLESRSATGVTEQWVDGGVRNVTPLRSAMDLNARAILMVQASAPKSPSPPGKLYRDLLKIGLRCTGILVSEVAANDVEHADDINALIKAVEMQRQRLQASTLTAAQKAAILAPLETLIAEYRYTPVAQITPPAGFNEADTMEFDPAKIAAAMTAGRKAVADAWPQLEAMLR
jgi:NTE family protein